MKLHSFFIIIRNFLAQTPFKTMMSKGIKKGLNAYKTLFEYIQLLIKQSKKLFNNYSKWHREFWTVKKINYTFLTLIVILSITIGINLIKNNITTITYAITQKQESFTELYFENHTELPVLLAAPNQYSWYKNSSTYLYTFSFTIHNLENKDMLYRYEVYSFENGRNTIDQGEVFIKNNESKTITENFTLPRDYTRTKVIVNLINKNQHLSFWMEEYNK